MLACVAHTGAIFIDGRATYSNEFIRFEVGDERRIQCADEVSIERRRWRLFIEQDGVMARKGVRSDDKAGGYVEAGLHQRAQPGGFAANGIRVRQIDFIEG